VAAHAGTVTWYTPASGGPIGEIVNGNEPSFARLSIIAVAAASPAMMPLSLAMPSGIAASEVVRASSMSGAAGK
jgi:hypothetical protein